MEAFLHFTVSHWVFVKGSQALLWEWGAMFRLQGVCVQDKITCGFL